MVSASAEIVIVFNGEVYNFREIATELVQRGHVLVSQSDTEVVLAAYREWGPRCVDRFIGMFAIAIWDGPQRCLRMFRDRLGVKPLYYTWDGQVLTFASELKALRALPHWNATPDPTAVGEFLQYGYIGAPRSIYGGVHKLLPGHWLHLGESGEPELQSYWSLTAVLAKGKLEISAGDAEAELESLLESAFRYRMVADVPVGLFLSGGVDSSLVAAILKKIGYSPVAFTIGFESAVHDETAAAAGVAAALGLEHRPTTITRTEAASILDQWATLYDEPFGDHSGVPTYLVAKLAREQVKVAVSADGGDELFCGYSGYPLIAERMARFDRWAKYSGGVGRIMEYAAAAAPGPSFGLGARLQAATGHGLMADRLHKMSGYLSAETPLQAIRPFKSFFQPLEISALLGTHYRDPRATAIEWPGAPMEQLMAMDLNEYLPDDVLTKVDRATMAVGLEGREPLIDHRIVEMAFRLPLSMKHGPLGNKQILRSILYRHIPRALVDRPKQGFSAPIADWMRDIIATGRMRTALDALSEKMPMLDKKLLREYQDVSKANAQGLNRLWLLYVLGNWAKRWA